jgi:hypothetical protein
MIRKILHITYYKSINPGTFLQAYAVETGLRKIFPNCSIEILQAKFNKKIHDSEAESFGYYYLMKSKIYTFIRLLKFRKVLASKFNETKNTIDAFSLTQKGKDDLFNKYDLIVIGSDTILERIAMEQIGIMWGSNTSNTPQIFFAASGDNCSYSQKELKLHDQIKSNINKFKYLGFRDDIIIRFLIDTLQIEQSKISMQPDPTYLLNLDQFGLRKYKHRKLECIKNNKLVFFHFDRRFAFRNELATELKKAGYFLVTPDFDPNCNISFKYLDPFEWGALFKYCDIILTERFHDTVFGLRYEKPVFTVDWNINKVNNEGESKRTQILRQYDLLKHHFSIFKMSDVIKTVRKIEVTLINFDPQKIRLYNEKFINKSQEELNNIYSALSNLK